MSLDGWIMAGSVGDITIGHCVLWYTGNRSLYVFNRFSRTRVTWLLITIFN